MGGTQAGGVVEAVRRNAVTPTNTGSRRNLVGVPTKWVQLDGPTVRMAAAEPATTGSHQLDLVPPAWARRHSARRGRDAGVDEAGWLRHCD
jgi:hypothetical protein